MRIWRRMLPWCLALAVASLAAAIYVHRRHVAEISVLAREFLVEHPFFSVREIQVKAGGKVGGSEIVAMAGLNHGMSIWKIHPRLTEAKVRRHPWVKRVLVRREFPRRVIVEVEERVARGIVVVGKLYYVDGEGVVFTEVGRGERMDLPLITGLSRGELTLGSTHRRIQQALRLADLMRETPLGLSEIRFLSSGGLVVYPTAHPVALHMGWDDWEGKLERVQRVLALWKGREDRLVVLDSSMGGQVVARLKKG